MSWQHIPHETRELYARLLTPIQLEVVRHKANGHSYRTIARAMNRDEATIRGHHRRAVERIRRHRKEAA